MKSSGLFVFSFFITSFGTFVNAQFEMPKYIDVAEAKNRQLIVIVNPPNPSIIHRFDRKSKPEVVKEYEQLIEDYNDNMKSLAKKFWTFNTQEILFKTRTELNDMFHDKAERDKYLLMYCYSSDSRPTHDFDLQLAGGGKTVVGGAAHFAIGFPAAASFYDYTFSGIIPQKTELANQIATSNYNFNYVFIHKDRSEKKQIVDDNMHLLARKTLLLLKDNVSTDALNDIGNWYSCKYKVVDNDEMERTVAAGDSSCAYVFKTGYYWIINCADGASLGYSLKGINEPAGGLKKEFFLDIAEYCNAGLKK